MLAAAWQLSMYFSATDNAWVFPCNLERPMLSLRQAGSNMLSSSADAGISTLQQRHIASVAGYESYIYIRSVIRKSSWHKHKKVWGRCSNRAPVVG